MRPKSLPSIRALTDRPVPTVSVDLHEMLPHLISNIIGDAAYHPRLRAKAIAELSSATPLRTSQRQELSSEIADEMLEMGHTKLEFTPDQVRMIIQLLTGALTDAESQEA